MTPNPIKTKEEYTRALERLEVIFDSKKGTTEGYELEVLAELIELYEDENFPIDLSDTIDPK